MQQEFSFDFFQFIATYIEACEVIRNRTSTILEVMLKETPAWMKTRWRRSSDLDTFPIRNLLGIPPIPPRLLLPE